MTRRALLLAALAGGLLGLAGSAHADAISAVAYLAYYIGGTAAAAVVTSAVVVSAYAGYVYAAYQVYGAIRSRRKAKAAANAARSAYNESLSDRVVTLLRAEPPWRVIYGRCILGGDIVAILSSDKAGIHENGAAYTKPDGLKHLVVAVAAHEVQQIHEVFIDGTPVGPLGADLYATEGEFGGVVHHVYQEVNLEPGQSITFDKPFTVLSLVHNETGDYTPIALDYSVVGNTVTNTTTLGYAGALGVSLTFFVGRVRVEYALGTEGQAANAFLQSVTPQWTATDRLAGIAYVVVTLDLEEPRFQGGPPALSFDVSGRKLYDPRTSTTVWSQNPALVVRDWLTGPFGFGVDAADLVDATVIAAANACDATISLEVGGDTTAGATYTCNGSVTTEASPEAVLDELCQSMAGFATHSGGHWVVNAGAYTVPVLHLSEDLQAGSIEVAQVGVGYDELINGVRGRMIEAGKTAEAEIDPYSNAVYVAADGRELWEDIVFPWTDNRARARNLARIFVESNRESLVIRYPAQLHAWPLQIGDRCTVSSEEYGWESKTFRVTDWQFGLDSPVLLTLQEDVPDIYDLADAATVDEAPNTGLVNPWVVPGITGVAATSGTAQALLLEDGTRVPRVRVTWNAVANTYVQQGGSIEVRWRRIGNDDVGSWRTLKPPGSATSEYLLGAAGGDVLAIGVRAVNSLGAAGDETLISHTVQALGIAPETVADLAGSVAAGIITWEWAPSVATDYAATELRSGGTTWDDAVPLWTGSASDYQVGVGEAGTYTVRAKHINRSGDKSLLAAAASLVVTGADLGGSAGRSVYTAEVFKQVAGTPPTAPTGGSFNFNTLTLVPPSGWLEDQPAGSATPTYSCRFTFATTTPSTTVVGGTWSDPVAVARTGSDGERRAQVFLYQFAPSTPATPTGSSTYTWATNAQGSYSGSGGDNWQSTVPSNPGTPGLKLWVATKQITGAAGVATTGINWTTGASVAAWSENGTLGTPGAPGAAGVQRADPVVYRWAATLPAGPVGAPSYVWAAGTFGTAPTDWYLQPPAPTPGFTLWAATVKVIDSATATSTGFNWSSASISARGYAGGPGTAGNSARIAYAKVTGFTLAPSPSTVTTMGSTSYPPTNSWGGGEVWGALVPSYGAGESVQQTDGIYIAGSPGQTVWGVPYISALKVGSLSAISVNTGALTLTGDLHMAGGGTIRAGNFTGFGFPAGGGTGFCLAIGGMLFGNPNGGGSSGYLELDANGNIYSPYLNQSGGMMTFSGTFQVGNATRSGNTMVSGTSGTVFAPGGPGSWGDSITNITYNGIYMKMNGRWVFEENIAFTGMTASTTPTSYDKTVTSASDQLMVTITGGVSGGVAPYMGEWAIASQFVEPDTGAGTIYIKSTSGSSNESCQIWVKGVSNNTFVGALLTLTVRDGNGRTAAARVQLKVRRGTTTL